MSSGMRVAKNTVEIKQQFESRGERLWGTTQNTTENRIQEQAITKSTSQVLVTTKAVVADQIITKGLARLLVIL
jgi:hypothetical protein